MDTKLTLNYRLLIIGLPLALILSMMTLVNSELYQIYGSQLAKAITLDLLLSTPLLYFLLIRKRSIPKITVVSVFIICLIAASYIIPKEDQGLLTIVKTYVLPIVELGIVSLVLWKAKQVYKTFKAAKTESPDFYDLIFDSTSKVLPTPVNGILATEIAVIYYGIINWKNTHSIASNEYTYHKKNGIFSVLYAFMGLACIELFVVHMLIAKYSNLWAWIATAFTLYSLLQIFALIKSMTRRPIILDYERRRLKLRYGFFSQVNINLNQIKNIELSRKSIPEDDKSTIPLSPLGLLDSHNMVLQLHTEHELIGFYGRKKKFMNLTLYADEKEKLENEIWQAIESNR